MAMRDMLRKVTGDASSLVSARAGAKVTKVSDAERLALLEAFESSNIGWFWATDDNGRITYLSPTAVDCFGEARQVQGALLTDLVETADDDGEVGGERPLSFFLGSHGKFRELVVRLQGTSHDSWWALTGHPHLDSQGNFLGFRGSAKDISDQFARRRDEARLAQYDTLTGLANRYRMTQRLESILGAFRVAKRSCALLMIDLDKFKQVNDSLGHPAGDELLRQVGQRLQRMVVAPAEIGRLGGDEFQIIVPDMDDRGHLGDLAEKLIQMISLPYSLGKERAIIGASVGIAIAPYDGTTSEQLVKNADLALYAAKGGGRGQFRFFASDLATTADRQRQLGEELRAAIKAGQLDMHYQPIVRASDNTVVAFEALLRWEHSELGTISPATFVPVAEELNLAIPLGEWAIKRACSDAAQWPGDIRVSVNISAQQVFAGTLPACVDEALAANGLRANRLELEIGEGVFLGETQAVDATFACLQKKGVRLSLDDFGKGHSSLAFLRRAPFERIKIDQSFVRGCCDPNDPNGAIVTAIVSLAGALDMETVAEGVEAMNELEQVRARGATLIQGFIFSRPVPQDVVMERLASGDFIYEPVGPDKPRAERRTVFLRIGVIHEDHRYDAILRNVSRTGALIEGLLDVPVGTELVLDLGGGQLAVATVRRSQDASQGVEFETPLVSDGANGLCTRHRVSPYQLASVGLSLASLDTEGEVQATPIPNTRRRFMQLDVSARSSRAA